MKLLTSSKNINKFYLLIVAIIVYLIYRKMTFAKYFKIEEFQSKDGAKMPLSVENNIKKLVKNLDIIREEIGMPIHVNSGYRSPQHNKAVGGVKNSFHMQGKAVDIHVKGMSSIELKSVIEKLINNGKIEQGGLGFYPTWVHYDNRGVKARWNG